MKHKILLILILLGAQTTFSQKSGVNPYTGIDKKALELPDSLHQDFL